MHWLLENTIWTCLVCNISSVQIGNGLLQTSESHVFVHCSFVEESNADRAIKALTSALAPKAKVIRDGEQKGIEAVDLVPGAPEPECCCCNRASTGTPSVHAVAWPASCSGLLLQVT